MRIGIDYRFLSAGVRAVNRGIGRYTQQQLREVVALDDVNEYVLFCMPGSNKGLILPEIRAARNVSIAEFPVSQTRGQEGKRNAPDLLLRHTEEYQDWIYRQRVDLYHATTPYVLYDIPLIQFDVCPYVSTYYDAIPLLYAPHYLESGSVVADLYVYANEVTRRSDRLIAISESARNDAVACLSVEPERIDIAYPIADPWFQPQPEAERERLLAPLRKRLGVDGGYILSVPHLHHSKNFENILAGYARLPAELRARLPMVVVCHLVAAEVLAVRALTDQLGITDSVKLSGFVSEAELAALYGQAEVFLHGSRYEGFGLPALEAMHCGAAVVASNSSSLPEVVGDAAVLVDPNDPDSIAEGVARVAGSPELQAELRARGLARADVFTGRRLGQATLDAYRRAVVQTPSAARPRVAFWTPLPPQPTGVADYAAELLGCLREDYEIEVFVDDGYLPSPDMWQTLTVQHHAAFERRQTQAPFDAVIYQMGASEYHWYMYEPLKRWHGIVMLHDLTWSHIQHLKHHQRNDMRGLRALVEKQENGAAVAAFDGIWQAPPEERPERLEAFLNAVYLLRDIVTASRMVIVPTNGLRDEVVARYAPECPIRVVPMGVTDPELDAPRTEKTALRSEAGIPVDAFVVGVFGSVAAIKRLDQIYRAFQTLRTVAPTARLLIIGDGPATYQIELKRLAEQLGIADAIVSVGHVPVMDPEDRKRFHQLLQLCDVVVNLRWPSHKQMSGTLARAIAAGKPIVVTDLPEWRHLPDTFCTRISPGATELAELTEALCRRAQDPTATATEAAAARAYFEANATLPAMAAHYAAAIDSLAPSRVVGVEPEGQPASGAWPDMVNRPLGPADLRHPILVPAWRELGLPAGASGSSRFSGPSARIVDVVQAVAWRALQTDAEAGQRHVLVLGAGAQALPFALTRVCSGVETLGDYSTGDRRHASMLSEPESWAPGPTDVTRLNVRQGDLRSIRFDDGAFDAVVSLHPLHWLIDPVESADLFGEVQRILRPGGLLILPAAVALSVAPGQEPAARALGLPAADAVLAAARSAGFLQPSTAQAPLIADVGPHLNLEEWPTADLEALLQTPVEITRGVVHTWAILALRRGDTPVAHSAPFQAPGRRPATRPSGSRARRSILRRAPKPARYITGSTHMQTQSRLNRFNQIRMLGWDNKFIKRLPNFVGVVLRGILRLIYLGDSQQMQSEIYDDLFLATGRVETGLSELQNDWRETHSRAESALEEIAQLRTHLTNQALPDELARRLDALAAQLDAMAQQQAADRQALERLTATMTAARPAPATPPSEERGAHVSE